MTTFQQLCTQAHYLEALPLLSHMKHTTTYIHWTYIFKSLESGMIKKKIIHSLYMQVMCRMRGTEKTSTFSDLEVFS